MPIVIGSREEGRAVEAATKARAAVPDGGFTGAENSKAVETVETVILSVPFRSQSETLKNLKELATSRPAVDRRHRTSCRRGERASDAHVGRMARLGRAGRTRDGPDGVRIVSALHTVSAASLTDLDCDLAQDVLVCGDSREDKTVAALLLQRIEGLRCVDCGRLEMARIAESMTALMISINAKHKTHAGIRITGLPDDDWK